MWIVFEDRLTDASVAHPIRLHVYIMDYLQKRNFTQSAGALAAEAGISEHTAVPVDAAQGLLFEWWTVFWEIFTAGQGGKQGMPEAMLYVEAQTRQKLANQQAINMSRAMGQPITQQQLQAMRMGQMPVTAYQQVNGSAQQQQQQQMQQMQHIAASPGGPGAGIQRPTSAAPPGQNPQRLMVQTAQASPVSPGMARTASMMAPGMPQRQTSLPVSAENGQHPHQAYYVQQMPGQSPHLGAAAQMPAKQVMRPPTANSMRAPTPQQSGVVQGPPIIQHPTTPAPETPGPQQPPSPANLQAAQEQQRARLAQQQHSMLAANSAAVQQQLLIQQQTNARLVAQQRHADAVYAPLGIGPVIAPIMGQAMIACGFHGRLPETLSQAEKERLIQSYRMYQASNAGQQRVMQGSPQQVVQGHYAVQGTPQQMAMMQR